MERQSKMKEEDEDDDDYYAIKEDGEDNNGIDNEPQRKGKGSISNTSTNTDTFNKNLTTSTNEDKKKKPVKRAATPSRSGVKTKSEAVQLYLPIDENQSSDDSLMTEDESSASTSTSTSITVSSVAKPKVSHKTPVKGKAVGKKKASASKYTPPTSRKRVTIAEATKAAAAAVAAAAAAGTITSIAAKRTILKSKQAQQARRRIERKIKRDAATELLRMSSASLAAVDNDGHPIRIDTNDDTIENDIRTVVELYNALGYNCVTVDILRKQAKMLVKTTTKWNNPLLYKLVNDDESLPNLDTDQSDDDDDDDDDSNNSTKEKSKTAQKSRSSKQQNVATANVTNNNNFDTSNIPQGDVPMTTTIRTDRTDDEQVTPPRVKKSGRPKGSTKDNPSRLRPKRKPRASNEKFVLDVVTKCAQLYHAARQAAHANNFKVKSGTLEQIIVQEEAKHNLPKGTIKYDTVRGRIRRKNLDGCNAAQLPLLGDAEAHVVDYCIKLIRMGALLDRCQTTVVANEVAKRYNLTERILMEKKKRYFTDNNDTNGTDKNNNNTDDHLLGTAWHSGFMNRNKTDILARSGVDQKRIVQFYDLLLDDFKTMYEIVYEKMVLAQVAEKIAKAAIYDFDGNRLSSENGRIFSYGLPTQYRLIKPEYFLYVDQLGSRTVDYGPNTFYRGNRINDPDDSGHVAGQTFTLTVESDQDTGCTTTDTNDVTYSVYCFNDAVGKVVACVIIFKSEKNVQDLPIIVRWGIDMFVPLNSDGTTELELFQNNCAPGEAMQGGPICNYNDIEVPCIVGTSVSGTMTSTILLEVCTTLDSVNLYDRSSGTKPFLLLDGHNCPFELPFLDYVHEPSHEWVVCCGLNRDTHLLRVSDPSEFNASFKENIASCQEQILLARRDDPSTNFYASDIVPMIRQAWESTYDDPIKVKRALALRGWNPMNYALLLHPILSNKGELVDTKKATHTHNEVDSQLKNTM